MIDQLPGSGSYTAVVFDAGLTLLYPDFPFLQKLLAGHGVDTNYHALAHGAALAREKVFRVKGNEENWRGYFSFWVQFLGAAESDVPEILRKLYERHEREHLWNWLDREAKETLRALRVRGYRLAIISNADGQVPAAMARLAIGDYFECIIDSALVGVEKPDRRIFILALEKLQLPGAACLYVGDHYDNDVTGARSAGLTPVLYDPFDVVPEHDVQRIRLLGDLLTLLPARRSDLETNLHRRKALSP